MSRESIGTEIAKIVMDLFNTLGDEYLENKEQTHSRRHNLRIKQAVSREDISQEIQRIKYKFEQEIKKKDNDFQKKKERKAKQEVKNYERFLDSIEDLREKLEKFYPNMSPVMVLIIHEYATQLLHKMWESPDGREKLISEKNFVEFLASVSEDTNSKTSESSHNSSTFPRRTLKYIQEKTK